MMYSSSKDNMIFYPSRPAIVGGDGRWMMSRPMAESTAPSCPRCNSINTKFCYYNNYSLAQPRYFCKSCRRYWTKGGSLRNVPVGGGCRKSRRSRHVRPSGARPVISGQDQPDGPNGPDRAGGGDASDIDLGALYAKFLDQPIVEPEMVGDNHGPGVQFPGPIGLEDVFMDDFMVLDQSQLVVATAVGDANGETFWAAPPGCSSAVPDYNEWQSTVEIGGVEFQPEVEMCFDDLVNGVGGAFGLDVFQHLI